MKTLTENEGGREPDQVHNVVLTLCLNLNTSCVVVETRKREILTNGKEERKEEHQVLLLFLVLPVFSLCLATMMEETSASNNRSSKGKKEDLFHVLHKVPYGDSPYVRAKHAQVHHLFLCFNLKLFRFIL